jgi:hypothetical protein
MLGLGDTAVQVQAQVELLDYLVTGITLTAVLASSTTGTALIM